MPPYSRIGIVELVSSELDLVIGLLDDGPVVGDYAVVCEERRDHEDRVGPMITNEQEREERERGNERTYQSWASSSLWLIAPSPVFGTELL